MKNTMKKLMSLVLVAILLISAVPFAASAATVGDTVTLDVMINGNPSTSKRTTAVYNEPVSINNCVSFVGADASLVTGVGVTQEGSGTVYYGLGDQFVITANTTVSVAVKAAPATYTVNVNYGDGRYETCKVTDGQAIGTSVLPDAPTSNGRQFAGWFLPSGTQVYSSTPVNSSWNGTTITAKWTVVGCVECDQVNGHKTTCSKYVAPDADTDSGKNTPTDSNKDTETTKKPITLNIKNAEGGSVVYTKEVTPNGDTAVVNNLLYYHYSKSWANTAKCTKAWSSEQQKDVGQYGSIAAGDTVTVVLTPTTSNGNVTGTGTNDSNTPANKFKWDIYLNIYVNNKVDAPAKTVKINDTIALDNTVSLDETMTIVDDYYYATNSTKGIQLDGLYQGAGNWALNFVTDSGKYNSFTNLDKAREQNYVFINVMATNVTAKSSGTADSSNPKTGDNIFMAVSIMGVSAAALATAFYFYNKKRQAI